MNEHTKKLYHKTIAKGLIAVIVVLDVITIDNDSTNMYILQMTPAVQATYLETVPQT